MFQRKADFFPPFKLNVAVMLSSSFNVINTFEILLMPHPLHVKQKVQVKFSLAKLLGKFQ